MNYTIDKDFALLYGILLGDGCLSLSSGKRFITITGSSEDDLSFFQDVIAPILRKFRGKDTKIRFRNDCNAIEYNFADKDLFNFINSLGFPIGKKGDYIFIPKIFYDNDLVSFVIAGFMATDGSLVLTKNPNKYYPRVEATSISKHLLSEVYNYLVQVGMKGHFYLAKRINLGKTFTNRKDCYRLQFNGKKNLVIFEEKIGFINPKAIQKFTEFFDYSDKYDSAIKDIPTQKQKFVRINKFSGTGEN